MNNIIDIAVKHSATTTFAAALSLSVLVIFLGFFYTTKELLLLFQEVAKTGIGDPKVIAGKISQALVYFVYYLIWALPGWVAAMYVVLFTPVSSRNYYRFLAFVSIFLILGIPFSTLFGVILGITLFFKRSKFKPIINHE